MWDKFNAAKGKTNGASLLGYGLIVGLVAVVGLGAITQVGDATESLFTETSDTLGGVSGVSQSGSAENSPSPTPTPGYYGLSDNLSSNQMAVIELQSGTTISSPADYHAACQTQGLSAYSTSGTFGSPTGCLGDLTAYPLRVEFCNMGIFNRQGLDYVFDVDVPSLAEVHWIAINSGSTISLESNAVGPCTAGTPGRECGTGSTSTDGPALEHARQVGGYSWTTNTVLQAGDHLLCTLP
ncbi:MAG: hypothetical protein Alpg2KO_22990 [Alphaproteobacteria bacterium]